MSDIENIITAVIRREGAYVNHPADRGGPTHYGITQRTLSRYLGRAVSISEIENLDQSLAREIYREKFYLAPGLDKLPEPIQEFVFDSAVNHGPKQALLFVQRSCNLLGAKPPLREDGIMGDNTRRAAATAARLFCARLKRTLLAERRNFYFRLVEAQPSQQIFLKGWLNRLAEFDGGDTRIV